MVIPKHIKKTIKDLPSKIGVYQYYDEKQKLLYVGKAKDIKKRVSSYFIKKQKNKKTKVLVSKIKNIKYLVVSTETDALLLENNLIKKHQPKYNVLLKDGKTYPWICISNEKAPRIYQTRVVKKNAGEYYGPYASTSVVKSLLSFFSDLFYANGWTPFSFLKRSIKSDEDLKNYLLIVNDIKKILGGKTQGLVNELRNKMYVYASNLEFEKAQIIKQQLALLKTYQAKSIIVNPKINNVDVFTIISDKNISFVNYLKINSGAIVQTYTLELKKKLNESEEDLLQLAIIELRKKFNSTSKTIYCSHPLRFSFANLRVLTPKIGDKKKLVDLSCRNAKNLFLNYKKQKTNTLKKEGGNRILKRLKQDLNLMVLPNHIECFDISNTQGENPVAACVVFKNAKASKKDYRHFNIKTVSGPDDFASMEEVVFRRYKRILEEGKDLPKLIVIDGGKGQLSSTIKSLERLKLKGEIAVIGIAKRLEEIYFPDDSVPLFLNKRSESLKLIQQLRDEAHRFSLYHHRNQRSKSLLTTSLDRLPGIGTKTIELLMIRFGSVKKVLTADKKELEQVIGKKKTSLIFKQHHLYN